MRAARAILWLAVVGAAAGCASLPPTNVPACDGTPELVCRTPIESARSCAWEARNVCERQDNARTFPCYVHAGARDDRQVYRFVWYGDTPVFYVPKTVKQTRAQCMKTLGSKSYCEWYDGGHVTGDCAIGYHHDRQNACYGSAVSVGLVTQRIVCHRDGASEQEPCGLLCDRPR